MPNELALKDVAYWFYRPVWYT